MKNSDYKTIFVSDIEEGIFVYDGVRYEINPDFSTKKKLRLMKEVAGIKGVCAIEPKKWIRTKKTVRIGFDK